MSEPLEGEIVNPSTSVILTKHPETVVAKLEEAFHNGYNITEACQYAGISRVTYYEWMGDDDGFSYRMSVAQGAINRKAKEIIAAGIQRGDTALALRYLQLRDPDFKPKVGIGGDTEKLQETQDKLKEFFDDRHRKNAEGAQPSTSPTD